MVQPALGSTQSAATQIRAGTLVRDALAAFELAGHRFAYSYSLVHRSLRFQEVTPARQPIERLRRSLEQIGLTLEPRAEKDWIIVPYKGAEPPPAQEPNVEIVVDLPLLEEVLVTSSRYKLKGGNAERASMHSLRENELNALPEIGDDALRAALHLPGMATVGVSAKPYVRGGSQDETLVLLDNMELFEPYHLRDFQSIFSSLNPALIESIDVYTGGFPARYGDRMSAVVDIKPVTGHTEVGGDLAISTLTTSAALYGPLGGGRGDWSLSARRGNLDWLTKQVNPDAGEPRYSDWYAQFSYALTPSAEISGTLVGYDDDIVLSDAEPGDGEDAQSRYHNVYGWVQLTQDLSDALTNTLSLSSTSIRHHRAGTVADGDFADSEFASLVDRRQFDIYSLQNRLQYQVGNSFGWELGVRLNYQRGEYQYRSLVARGELAELLGNADAVSLDITEKPSGTSGALFASAYVQAKQRLSLEAGLRYDFQNFSRQSRQQFSPRLSVRYQFAKATNLRLSAGRFFQAEGIHELNVPDGRREYQRPQRADHYIAALSHEFGDSGLSLRSELFYKRLRQVKVRYENLFNPFVMLPELAADRVTIAADKGRARGLELSFGYNRDDRFVAWASYTLGKAEDYLEGRWEPRSWDQRHTLSTGLIARPGKWELSLSLLAHSGWPTTRIPAVLEEDQDLVVQRNAGRLKNYFSLDLRAARRWERGRHRLLVFAEVTNASARKNVGSTEIDIEEDEESGQLFLETTQEPVFPWIPSIGLQWTF